MYHMSDEGLIIICNESAADVLDAMYDNDSVGLSRCGRAPKW